MSNFTAIDFETANSKPSSICQVGLAIVEDCKIVDRISYLVRPICNEYSPKNIEIHGITPEMTKDAETFDLIYLKIKQHIEGKQLVAHNAAFDMNCLQKALALYGIQQPKVSWYCTYKIYKESLPQACLRHGISVNHHIAESDAEACALLMIKDIQRTKVTF
jgi:DNA polymerase-3 subunit epsilon